MTHFIHQRQKRLAQLQLHQAPGQHRQAPLVAPAAAWTGHMLLHRSPQPAKLLVGIQRGQAPWKTSHFVALQQLQGRNLLFIFLYLARGRKVLLMPKTLRWKFCNIDSLIPALLHGTQLPQVIAPSSSIPKPSSRASAAMTSALRWPMTNSAWRIPGVFEAGYDSHYFGIIHPSLLSVRDYAALSFMVNIKNPIIQIRQHLPTKSCWHQLPLLRLHLFSTRGPQGTAAGCWTTAGWQRTRRCWPKFVTSTPWGERLDHDPFRFDGRPSWLKTYQILVHTSHSKTNVFTAPSIYMPLCRNHLEASQKLWIPGGCEELGADMINKTTNVCKCGFDMMPIK